MEGLKEDCGRKWEVWDVRVMYVLFMCICLGVCVFVFYVILMGELIRI